MNSSDAEAVLRHRAIVGIVRGTTFVSRSTPAGTVILDTRVEELMREMDALKKSKHRRGCLIV